MATAMNGKRDVIRFEPDQAVTVQLKYAGGGRAVSGQHGPQMMYTTVDNRVFFLEPEIAASLDELNPAAGEKIRIAKVKRPGTNRVDWDIERVQPQTKPHVGQGAMAIATPQANHDLDMAECFRAALDAISEAQEYSNRKGIGIAFTSDNVTSAALSAFIAKTRERAA